MCPSVGGGEKYEGPGRCCREALHPGPPELRNPPVVDLRALAFFRPLTSPVVLADGGRCRCVGRLPLHPCGLRIFRLTTPILRTLWPLPASPPESWGSGESRSAPASVGSVSASLPVARSLLGPSPSCAEWNECHSASRIAAGQEVFLNSQGYPRHFSVIHRISLFVHRSSTGNPQRNPQFTGHGARRLALLSAKRLNGRR